MRCSGLETESDLIWAVCEVVRVIVGINAMRRWRRGASGWASILLGTGSESKK